MYEKKTITTIKIIISEAYFRKGTKWRSLHANPLLCQPVPLPNIVTKFAYVILYTLHSATYYFRAKSLEKSASAALATRSPSFIPTCRRRSLDAHISYCTRADATGGNGWIQNHRWQRSFCRDTMSLHCLGDGTTRSDGTSVRESYGEPHERVLRTWRIGLLGNRNFPGGPSPVLIIYPFDRNFA